ncbi:hypothetical protein D918_09983 [Trichuris suis]|nr:hypothetical protein D918_09983 [Trichuris suis]
MRSVDLPVKADIMISEMLGSFGDNELSPECLDGALHLLKEDGISIPCCYESFVSPAHAAKVTSQMASLSNANSQTDFVSFETMIVVKLHSHFVISSPKSVFRFAHPNRDQLSNNRYKRIHFVAPIDCVLGGFAGYFRANLYGDVFLSTVPSDHTPNMTSWFAMWIPLQHSIQLKKGQTIELHIWRFSTHEKVCPPSLEDTYCKQITVCNNECMLWIMDTVEQDGKSSSRYISWADIFLLLYSVTDKDSFEYAENLLKEIRGHDHSICVRSHMVCLIGNKSDLERYSCFLSFFKMLACSLRFL